MEKLPKGIILAAHKPIASAMLKAATQIMGPIDHCAAADIDSDAKERPVRTLKESVGFGSNGGDDYSFGHRRRNALQCS